MRAHAKARSAALGLILILMANLPGVAQEAEGGGDFRPRIAIIPVRNDSGEPAYDAVARTVSDSVGLVLRLLGDYAVTEVYDEPDLATVDIEDAQQIAALADGAPYEEVIFGNLIRNDQRQLEFRLNLYSAEEQGVRFAPTAVARSIFAVFDAADEITVALVSEFSDVRVGFGALEITLVEGDGLFDVFLDNTRIRNPEADLQNVLNGSYELTIRQDRLLGETVIFRQQVEIFENRTTSVEFSIPAATDEEISFLRQRSEQLIAAAADPDRIEDALLDLAEFQALTRLAGNDPTLQQIGSEALAEATERTSASLETLRAQADELYYADDPDFAAAEAVYQQYASLISAPFEISQTRPFSGFTQPQAITAVPGGYALAGNGISGVSVFLLDEDLVQQEVVTPTIPRTRYVSLATGPSGVLHVSWTGAREVLRYRGVLEELPPIPLDPRFHNSDGNRLLALAPSGELAVLQGDQVLVLDPEGERDEAAEANFLQRIAELGALPTALAYGPRDLLHLFAAGSERVIRVDSLGRAESTVDLPGSAGGTGIGVDALGNIYVTLPAQHQVWRYSAEGVRLSVIGSFGTAAGEFRAPSGIFALPDGTLLVADTFGDRIQRLTPTGPPIQSVVVADFGRDFQLRQQTAATARQRMEIVEESIRPGRVLGNLTSGAVAFGVTLGAFAGADIFASLADQAFAIYTGLGPDDDIASQRAEVERNWTISRLVLGGGVLGIGVTSYLVTNSLLLSTDFAVARRTAVRELQALDIGTTYETDPDRWRSLRTANRLGRITGVLPPVLGLGLVGYQTIIGLPEAYESYYYPVLIGTTAVPPLFGHLYGGRFHLGLFLAGLAADALVIGAWQISTNRPEDFAPTGLSVDAGGRFADILNGMWEQAQVLAPELLTLGGLGIRLTAGAYDARRGWVQTRDRNRYQAVRPVEDL